MPSQQTICPLYSSLNCSQTKATILNHYYLIKNAIKSNQIKLILNLNIISIVEYLKFNT